MILLQKYDKILITSEFNGIFAKQPEYSIPGGGVLLIFC